MMAIEKVAGYCQSPVTETEDMSPVIVFVVVSLPAPQQCSLLHVVDQVSPYLKYKNIVQLVGGGVIEREGYYYSQYRNITHTVCMYDIVIIKQCLYLNWWSHTAIHCCSHLALILRTLSPSLYLTSRAVMLPCLL